MKISDFGMSKALAKEYKINKAAVKWMAIESIDYSKFSTFSDGSIKLLLSANQFSISLFQFGVLVLFYGRFFHMEEPLIRYRVYANISTYVN